jgi:polyisoprenyl-teichoic acid--peptidoglycan teichoic acid transferase
LAGQNSPYSKNTTDFEYRTYSVKLNGLIAAMLTMFVVLPFVVSAQNEGEVVPDPVPLIDESGYDIVNFLLIGSDTFNPNNNGRTDVMVIVSVNRTAQSVSLLSLPRDLYVYIPGDRMYRLNTAFSVGEALYGDGAGAQHLIDTIQYNLGLVVDYWARVDFNDFQNLVNDLGGVEISVDCAIEDWELISTDLDPNLEESWQLFTLPVGVHQFDGSRALWYARSRRTSSDFDRGRRHQALLRAMWARIQDLSLAEQITDVFPQLLEAVDTNIPLDVLLSLVPFATSLENTQIASYTFRQNVEVRLSQSPEGSSVLVLNQDAIRELELQMLTPSTSNQIRSETPVVEIINASGIRGMERVAADRLMLDGYSVIISSETAPYQNATVIQDLKGRTKGSSLSLLADILRIDEQYVEFVPDPAAAVDFRVVLGGDYFSCTHNVLQPTG